VIGTELLVFWKTGRLGVVVAYQSGRKRRFNCILKNSIVSQPTIVVRTSFKETEVRMWSYSWTISNAKDHLQKSDRGGQPLTSSEIIKDGLKWRLVLYPRTGEIYMQLTSTPSEPLKAKIT